MKNDCWVTILLISIFNINIDNSNDDKYSYSPHLGHIGSAVRLELGHEDPHDVQNEDQINLEILLFLNKTGSEKCETHSVGRQHGRRDEIEKVGGLRPARPAGVLRGDAQLGGAVRPGACLGGHLSLHGDCPDTDEHHRHH